MTAALEPCPNPECPGSEPVIDQHPQILTSKAVRVICLGCQTCGPLRNTEAEARRLWNALPRALKATTGFPSVPGWYWQYVPGHGWLAGYLDETDCSEPLRLDHCTHIAGPLVEPAIPQPPTPAERSDRP